MSRVICYVDGFNLYHALRETGKQDLKWLSLVSVAQLTLRPGDVLMDVHYFTAAIHWDGQKARRHREYIAALQSTGVQIENSRFVKNHKMCRKFSRSCPFYEEKQTDVGLATRVLRDALSGIVDRQIMVTADSDHVPLFRHIRESCPSVRVEVLAPPGRLARAREPGNLAHWHSELTIGQLKSCTFPRNVCDRDGRVVARAPAAYV